VELEMQWLVGGGLQINISGDYLDAYYTSVNSYANIPQSLNPDGSNNCDANGIVQQPPPPHPACAFPGAPQLSAKLPKTPKWKGSIWPSYDFFLKNQSSIRVLAAYTYTSDLYNDALNTPELHRPATHQLDASLHYISSGGKYDLAVGGSNLTNDRFCTAGSPNAGAGEVGCYYNPPRMWYLSLRAEFGGK
jgi:iron complex outermembrane receptor protein